jgi:hypothetical protein
MRATKTLQAAACSLRAAKDEVQDALSFSVWQENGTCKAFFLCMAVSNAIKKRGHLDDYKKVVWKYGKAKEAVDSARDGLLLLGESVRKSRKEKKRKGLMKARRWLQQRQRSVCPNLRIHFFWFTSIGVLK